MNERLGILFLHYHVDQVVENNLRSIRQHNPQAVVATISAGETLPGGYTMEATPQLKQLHSLSPTRSSDRMVCSWFLQRKEVCEKWWIVEWDTYCAMSVQDYYQPAWEFSFVAPSVRLTHREPEWYWFLEAEKQPIPSDYQPFLTGAIPFLYLISEPALNATCAMLLAHPLDAGNGELRFATAANRCGYAPCGFSPPHDQITWIPWKILPPKPAIVHPVKHFVEFNAQISGG